MYQGLRRVDLKVDKFTALGYVSRYMKGNLDVEAAVVLDEATDEAAIQLVAYIAGESLAKQTVRYPKNWWQAVKERFAPALFKRRYPVVYTEVVMEAKAYYPLVSVPKERHYVHVVRYKT